MHRLAQVWLAKRLSVRLIIVQVRRALVGSKSEAVFICMSVRYGFTIEFTHSLRTSLAHTAYDARSRLR